MRTHPLLDTRPVDALVHAGAYVEPVHLVTPTPAPRPLQLLADIQAARVDLYCDHNDLALRDIRAARRHLEEADPAARKDVLDALNRAAWLARHDDYAAAEEQLEHALDRLRL